MKNNVISIVLVFLVCGCGGMSENKSLEADKAIWQQHREIAKARAYQWLTRSHYNTTPWFVEGESLVHADGKLVALRYHMAAVSGIRKHDYLKQLQTHRQATHIIQYSFVKHEWTLVHPVGGKAKPYKERLGGKAGRTPLSEKARVRHFRQRRTIELPAVSVSWGARGAAQHRAVYRKTVRGTSPAR